jgi:hypothetical protein
LLRLQLPLSRVVVVLLVLKKYVLITSVVALGAGCDSGPRGSLRQASSVRAPQLRAAACSDIPVATGRADVRWLLAADSDDPSRSGTISATDIARAPDGSLVVLDRFEGRVSVVDTAGYVRRTWGQAGDVAGALRSARSIALGLDQRIYVAGRAGRISVFSSAGVYRRSIRIQHYEDVADLLVLPNGNFVVATDANPREKRGAYVSIVDSTGELVRDVLILSREGAGRSRPLMGAQLNWVRLTQGPRGKFAVWYPMDNYVGLFDSAGASVGVIKGCLPRAIEEAYAFQARRTDGQAAQVLTLGVSLDDSLRMRILSFHKVGARRLIRLRHYSVTGQEVQARDFDVSELKFFDRGELVGRSELVGFSSVQRESGLRRLDLR